MIKEKYKKEYASELSRLFYFRINLFCWIAISAFTLEILLGISFFKHILNVKDLPGIIGGIIFSITLLATGKINNSLNFQKARAYFFSLLLITISILSASAHPEIIEYLGISIILLAFFVSVLLLPWRWYEAFSLGIFTIINYVWIYKALNTYVNNEIFIINSALLLVSVLIATVVERSEELLRLKDFSLRKDIEEKNLIMAKELELANKIHKSLMPQSIETNLADVAVLYQPMFYMGGDYAKFSFIDDNKLLFIVADVTGHGVCSALLVNRVHTEIERLIDKDVSPGSLLKKLDNFINKDFGKMGYYLSAFCGMLDFSSGKLIYSNYGHPPQILLQSKNTDLVLMKSQTFLMGIGMDSADIYSAQVDFSKGDRLVLFTDGIIEAKNTKNELFGYERLESFIRNNSNISTIDFSRKLSDEISRYQSNVQSDDIFILTIQIK